MNGDERERLIDIATTLGRIDEKVNNIYTLTEKQERHLEKLNNNVGKNARDIAVLKWTVRLGGSLVGLALGITKILHIW